MARKKQQEVEKRQQSSEESQLLRKQTIKELIAPSGIDASNLNHLEIISHICHLFIVIIYHKYYD